MIYFRDRDQAAEALAEKLRRYSGENPLVLAIPRGSVPMARIVAERIGADLDVVLVHKIGAPDNPEFAIGSVGELGRIYRSQAIEFYEISSDYVEKAAKEEIAKLRQRRALYSGIRPPIDPAGRTVVIVDDGIATGATLLAAIRSVRSKNPTKIVVAAPVAAPSAALLLEKEADELVILQTPEDFYSISQFYADFPQITDDQVIEALARSAHFTTKGFAA